MTTLGILLLGVGLLFIWAAVKGENPGDQLVQVIATGPQNPGATP